MSQGKLLVLLVLWTFLRFIPGTIDMDIWTISICPRIKWLILEQMQYLFVAKYTGPGTEVIKQHTEKFLIRGIPAQKPFFLPREKLGSGINLSSWKHTFLFTLFFYTEVVSKQDTMEICQWSIYALEIIDLSVFKCLAGLISCKLTCLVSWQPTSLASGVDQNKTRFQNISVI